VGDGIARIYGLDEVMAGELVEFERRSSKVIIFLINPIFFPVFLNPNNFLTIQGLNNTTLLCFSLLSVFSF
jgi:F0F1-type ATP synthase alpha subunit